MASNIDPTARIYRDAEVSDSTLHEECIIGDFSRVRQSVVGRHCSVDRQNLLLGVNLGERSYTGPWNMIFHAEIGRFCSISYGVTIGPPDHALDRISTHPFLYDAKFGIMEEDGAIRNEKFARPCKIGHDVWIGANATVLRGVEVGNGAVIGANSMVNKDVPPYAIVGGTPARIIRYRFSPEIIAELERIRWWEWPDDKLRRHKALFSSKEPDLEVLRTL